MSSLKNRVINALGVNVYAQVIGLCIQLLTIPALLSYWGLEQFGVWTYCMAISVYFGLADFGFMAAGMNKVSLLSFKGEPEKAQTLISSMWKLMLLISMGIMTVLLIFLDSDINADMNLHTKSGLTLLYLIGNVMIALSSSIFDAIFRANNEYSKGTAILETIRLVEWLAMIGAALIGGDMVLAASSMCLARLICTIALYGYIELNANYQYKNKPQRGSVRELKELKLEAFSWSAVRYGESIALQGPVILAERLLGPNVAALVSSYRTLSRSALQFSTLIGHSLWPEFSRSIAMGDQRLTQELLKKSTVVTFIGSVSIAIAILILLTPFLQVWGRGKIPVDHGFLAIFLAGVIVTATWYPAKILMMASSALNRIGFIYFIINIVGMALLYILVKKYGDYSIPSVVLVVEAIIGMMAWKVATKLVSQDD